MASCPGLARRAGLSVVAASLLVAGFAAPSQALTEPTVAIVSPTAGATVAGATTVQVDVTLNDETSMDVYAGVSPSGSEAGVTSAHQVVTAQDCPQTCRLTFTLAPSSFDNPLPAGPIEISLWGKYASDPYNWEVLANAPLTLDAPDVVDTDAVTDNTLSTSYPSTVFDASGTATVHAGQHGSPEATRPDGEQVELRLYKQPAWNETQGQPVTTQLLPWSPDANGNLQAVFHVDTAAVPDGTYWVKTRARDTRGNYGYNYDYLTIYVRHEPSVSLDLGSNPYQKVGATSVDATLSLRGPWPKEPSSSGETPPKRATFSVDHGTAQPVPEPNSWPTSDNPNSITPHTWGWLLPTPALTQGDHTISVQLYDTYDRPMGPEVSQTVHVVQPNEAATIPTLVVGQPATLRFTGTAPLALLYNDCGDTITINGALANGDTLCTAGVNSFSAPVTWTPRVAGPAVVNVSADMADQAGAPTQITNSRNYNATVYARRVATISNVLGTYGTVGTATVTVTDLRNIEQSPVEAAGVLVTVQRLAAGTKTWQTLGAVRTGTTGVAKVSFTNSVSGRLRALVPSTVPGATVSTAWGWGTSNSTAAWTSLPTWTRAGWLVTAKATTRPYDAGARALVQVYRAGTYSWATVANVPVTSTGAVTASFRLNRGTYTVRVYRLATATHAGSVTSQRTLRVY